MAEAADLYKVLQVDPEADPEIIQAAYRRLAQMHPPDCTGDLGSASRMAAINEAWAVLGDRARRAAYDRARAARRPAPPGASSGTAGPRAGEPVPGAPAVASAGAQTASWGPPRASRGDRPGEPVSRDWMSGRSGVGGGYDPASMRTAEGEAAAGPPPGNPSGSVLGFGRYAGWSIGEIARRDPDYLLWLERLPMGRQYRDELDDALRRTGRRRRGGDDGDRRGLFRR